MIKVFVHDFAEVSKDTVLHRLQQAASFFLPHNICFLLGGYREYSTVPKNMRIMDVRDPEAVDDLEERLVPGLINVFLHEEVQNGGADDNSPYYPDGYTYYLPGWYLSIGTLKLTTLAHQLAHCFGLYDANEVAFGKENVPRTGDCSNCTVAGDLLCDTRADRYFADSIIGGCTIGYSPFRDECGNMITGSQPENLMSGSKESCRKYLVGAQGTRARNFILSRSYLSETITSDEDLTVTSDQSYSSGTNVFAVKNSINVQPSAYTVSSGAKVHFSSRQVTFKPGVTFSPGSSGEVQAIINTVNCN